MRGLIPPFWPPARLDFFIVPSQGGGSGIMNHGYKKCKNHGSQVCFKNLGNMNLCTSARESWTTRLWEKLNKMHVWINCVRARECGIWRFRESNFQKIFLWASPRTPPPPYIIRAFGADSPLVSPVTLVLNVQFLHTWTKRMITSSMDENRTADRSLNTKETIQNEIKLPLRLNNFNRWSKVFVNRESGRKVW